MIKTKVAQGHSFVFNDITHAALDVVLQLFARGITIAPLRRIAISSHLRASMGKDCHKGIKVGVCSGADSHVSVVQCDDGYFCGYAEADG